MRASVNVSHIQLRLRIISQALRARRGQSSPHFCEEAAFIPLLPIAW
jgi:hypothetical protein